MKWFFLFDTLDGRGAFRKFKNVLHRYPQIEEQWYKYKEKRKSGKAGSKLEYWYRAGRRMIFNTALLKV